MKTWHAVVRYERLRKILRRYAMRYCVGIDYAKAFSYGVIMDEKGSVVHEGKINNNRESLEQFLAGFNKEQLEAVVESTRNWMVIYDMLEEFCAKVVLAHPVKLKVIADTVCKTDRVDAKVLANLLRVGLIPKAYVPKKENRPIRDMLRQRMFFVRVQTMIKNRILGILDRYPGLGRPKVADIFGKEGMAWVKSINIPQEERKLLDRELVLLETVKDRVSKSNDLVKKECTRNNYATLISTVPGMGNFFSLLMASEIDDIERFRDPKKLQAYCGLTPILDRSGGKIVKRGGLPKKGNKWIRWAAVEAAIPAIRTSGSLRALYESTKYRKGSNPAKIAVARKLLKIIWHVLKENRSYKESLGCPHKTLADAVTTA